MTNEDNDPIWQLPNGYLIYDPIDEGLFSRVLMWPERRMI